MWMRFSWPRLRVDQILTLAWKGLFELTLINIFVTAILIAIWPDPDIGELLIMSAINWVVFFISIWAVRQTASNWGLHVARADGRSSSVPGGDGRVAG